MITYLYWGCALFVAGAVLYYMFKAGYKNKSSFIVTGLILLTAWASYTFYLQQIFVKRWGGVMSITVPSGQQYMGMTWKEDNLWLETYDPKKNQCRFAEYSRGDLLQGRVIIKNCNPR
ncbi:hypothetical protein EDC56_0451 [Sinobacterium caligoides]|uniref:Uncharacterized protein n=1 Tax=Sinobacterium caligoides TaxID=933926 RepID=A0A3N2DYR7_9GAMM|nr:hypothetical protein [Sinobacterium caligoides]ROS04934.1 hypothetical protein EDC56_0451 [Sinobacterium caligoides]